MNKMLVDKKVVLYINETQEIDLSIYDTYELICNIKNGIDVFISDINSNIEKYTFNCDKDSNIEINKFNNNNITCNIDINLQENSKAILVISTVSSSKNMFDINVNHIGPRSYSKCINNGVVRSGSITYNVNGIINRGAVNSSVLQTSKIITKDLSRSVIKPVLIIDDTVEEANHSASIGYYDLDLLFYLESRGIKPDDAIRLLNKGLLTSNFKYKEKIENLI